MIEFIYKKKWFEENLSGLILVVVFNLNVEIWNFYILVYDIDVKDLIKVVVVC